jgi:RNA polymerase sigma-70 factor (ECF subfamily)
LEIPAGNELSKRLETVYTVLYLLFNEGYNSSKADELIRKDLCAEAMRLCMLLAEHKSGRQPATYALLSLMCFHASRFDSRIDENNSIILLQHQDRSKWNTELIDRGYYYLSLSAEGNIISVYHIESAIAAEHCMAANFAATNWERILALYDLLLTQKTTPTVILNRAIALAHLNRVAEAVAQISGIEGIDFLMESQYIYNAVLGDLFLKLKQHNLAEKHLTKACQLTHSQPEKNLINEKLDLMKRYN